MIYTNGKLLTHAWTSYKSAYTSEISLIKFHDRLEVLLICEAPFPNYNGGYTSGSVA